MGKWYLIMTLLSVGGADMHSIPMDNQAACVKAAKALKTRWATLTVMVKCVNTATGEVKSI